MHRRTLLTATALAALLGPVAAWSATREPFTEAAFHAAQAAGKPILVEVDAPWCPYCAKQRPILSNLAKMPEFANMVFFKVDFDSQKAALKALKVQKQATLIVFQGKKETVRSTGETDPGVIRTMLETGEN